MPTTAEPPAIDCVRATILALRPEISASALNLTHDQAEARKLTHRTLDRALEQALDAPPSAGADGELDTRLWLFSMLRAEFHSVERQRQAHRERGFTVAAKRAIVTEKPQ